MSGIKIKNKSTTYWILARKVIQTLALAFFLSIVVFAQRNILADNLLSLPMRLDPLVMLANALSSREVLLTSTLALITIILTIIFGRAWCGWLCPLGTILDLFSFKKRYPNPIVPPQGWRSIKYSLLLMILFAALLGNLTLLILDPMTIFTRSIATLVMPGLDQIVTIAEQSAYRLPGMSGVITEFDEIIRPNLFPLEPLQYRYSLVFLLFLLGIISLNILAPRFWCRYLCPLGAMLGFIAKFSLFRRKIGSDCKSCSLCDKACPMGTIDPDKGYSSDPGECTMCLNCLQACPRSSITFSKFYKPGDWNRYDPGRRQALISFSAVIAGVAVMRSDSLSQRRHQLDLLPPAADSDRFLSQCIRCAVCIRACPTGALQPSQVESGLQGFWAPILVPRLGYCDYSCHACGQVCPTHAIPALTLDQKRTQVIGKAYIDRDRCLAWSDGISCIVCEEMCPIPEKAIKLEPSQVQLPDGARLDILLPHVQRELCIGCGICEYRCPVVGEAAIRVFVAE
jgi:polyferredoxin